MRRSLPHVDFTKLEPGRLTKFQEGLLAPTFSPGLYIVSVWIPSTDPSLKVDRAHNSLLSSNDGPELDCEIHFSCLRHAQIRCQARLRDTMVFTSHCHTKLKYSSMSHGTRVFT